MAQLQAVACFQIKALEHNEGPVAISNALLALRI